MVSDQTSGFDFPEVAVSLVELEVAILIGPTFWQAVGFNAGDLEGMIQQGVIRCLLTCIESRIIRSSWSCRYLGWRFCGCRCCLCVVLCTVVFCFWCCCL